MPELPEVETVVRQLSPFMMGRRVERLDIRDEKLSHARSAKVKGKSVESVSRLGKQIGIGLANGSDKLWMAFHLRMTGRLITSDNREEQNDKHLRAELVFDRGSLLFYDTRRFGTIRVAATAEELLPDAVDPMTERFTGSVLAGLIGTTTTPVKNWLLRQDKLVGIGNIYASEILFGCRIDPRTPAGKLSKSKVFALRDETRRVLELAIEHCGTTFSDFQDSQGHVGRFQNFLRVYAREGEPCHTCGTNVERIVQGQRSTYFCPHCQI
jgi:formamidopyrimidine-DNA glycosylase